MDIEDHMTAGEASEFLNGLLNNPNLYINREAWAQALCSVKNLCDLKCQIELTHIGTLICAFCGAFL